jgi:IS5 family transposase
LTGGIVVLDIVRCKAAGHIRSIGSYEFFTVDGSRSGSAARSAGSPKPSTARCAAVEPVIGHLKNDQRMRRNHLRGRAGDRVNAVLAAAGYNFSLLLRWFEELLRVLLWIICPDLSPTRLQ